ncbi:DUF6236 family protein, partial [uncultured Thiodictyon sp.]|uniref:DUF6236 family protein n=1 Tax=uncultured Thiodictyon sp. TaxID=1846217 RepID=UPI0025D32277
MQQNALYYPHIALQDPSWIKAMALFYDNIYRIVPDNIIPDDSEDLAALLEEGSVGRMIDPANYSRKASEEFLSKIDRWNAAALTYNDEDEALITKLHTEKTDERVREIFQKAGFRSDNDWMYVPTAIASNFMLYMATQIATSNQLSLITSDWGAWTGTSYFGVDGQVDDFITNIGKGNWGEEYAESFGLFGLIVTELVPINISEIPSEKILEFREKRRSEIAQFRSCMHDLRKELTTLESHEIRIDTVREKAKELIRAQEQYKASADVLKAKGWFGISLMGFPAPMIFAVVSRFPLRHERHNRGEQRILRGFAGIRAIDTETLAAEVLSQPPPQVR